MNVNVQKHLRDTYLATIHNSIGTKMFRNLYADVDGDKVDILKDGEDACAIYVSSMLYLFDLLPSKHATVSGTKTALEKFSWEESQTPKPGDVLLWEKKEDGRAQYHQHVGFFLGDEMAVSNDPETRAITRHEMTFGRGGNDEPNRAIEAIFTYPWPSE